MVKKLAALFMVMVMTLNLSPAVFSVDGWDGSIATSFDSGSGTQSDPYVIMTSAQLARLASIVNSAGGPSQAGVYFELGADINLGGVIEWTPIGASTSRNGKSVNSEFAGHFDGKGHTISNLKITALGAGDRVGLFGTATDAVIKNLKLEGANIIHSPSGGNYYTGGIAALIQGEEAVISGCFVDHTSVIRGTTSLGGIAGRASDKAVIEYCINEAAVACYVSSNAFTGGIVGAIGSLATVRYCANKGVITQERTSGTATTFYAGGIAGIIGTGTAGATLESCYNTRALSGVYATGGIVGRNHYDNYTYIVKNCYNYSTTIMGDSAYTGSIIGWIRFEGIEFTDCASISVAGVGLFGTNQPDVDTSALTIKSESQILAFTNTIDNAINTYLISQTVADGTEIEARNLKWHQNDIWEFLFSEN